MDTTASTDYLSVAEAATILKVTESTVRRWIRRGDLPAYRTGRRGVRVKREDLEREINPFVEFQRMQDEPTLPEVIEELRRPLSEEKRKQWRAAIENARRLAAAMLAERGGE